jgi:proline iminopeptidase
MPRRPSLATLALLALVAAPLVAIAAEAWEREFAAGMDSTDSSMQYVAITKLDPNIPKAREYLYSIAGAGQWHNREGVIETLAKADKPEAVEDLRKNMKSHKAAGAREAIVLAFGRAHDAERIADLIEALKDKAPEVRRAAALMLLENPSKEGVSAIIDAWKKEKEWTVSVYYKDTLEKLTKNFFGWQIQDWENWWLAKQDKWRPPKPKKEPRPGEKEAPEGEKKDGGDKKDGEKKDGEDAGDEGGEGKEKPAEETTTLRDVELTIKESGKGGPLFVIPPLYRNKVLFEKHLQSIEDTARLFYIDLPAINKFRGLKNEGKSGIPFYPLDMVVDAFDELRKSRKQEQIAILGVEQAAWVAMKYATKYPKNVSHLILISTWSCGKAWEDGIRRIEAEGKTRKNPEMEHTAKHRTLDQSTGKHGYEAKDPQEEEAINRMEWTLLWGDPRNIFSILWYKSSENPIGGCYSPKFDIAAEKANKDVPTLICYGTKSLWVSPADMKALNKTYPNSTVVECPSSADMPWVEDHDTFTKAVHGFFKKHPFPRKSGK